MNLKQVAMRLPLKDPFTIARGTITHQDALVVQLEHDGIVGLGEVTANDFYGHTLEAMSTGLEKLEPTFLNRYVETPPEELWSDLVKVLAGDMFAVSALDMAAQDWWARRESKSVWQRWGLEWNDQLRSSFTIGIDSIPEMERKLDAEAGWPIYKIKLGTPQDLEIVRTLRQHTNAVFRVDANCGWSVEETIHNSRELAALNVQFIEQPLPREATVDQKREVYQHSALPLIADEDCQTIDDLPHCFELFHGINIKLCKCGGLTPALSMLKRARQAGKRTMIGCMVESAIGISGSAQLGPLLDYADLDGNNLLSGSPTTGVRIQKGTIQLPTEVGTGSQLIVEQMDRYMVP